MAACEISLAWLGRPFLGVGANEMITRGNASVAKGEGQHATTIFDAFGANVRDLPDNDFICTPPGLDYAPDGSRLTYAEAARQIAALAEAYRRAGYGPSCRVALLLEARPIHFLHFLALNSLGVGQVPINPDLQPAEIRYQLELAGCSALVCLSKYKEKAIASAAGLNVAVVDAEAGPLMLPAVSSEMAPINDRRSREAALFFTSGTTGNPKACILTNGFLLHMG